MRARETARAAADRRTDIRCGAADIVTCDHISPEGQATLTMPSVALSTL
ncbi:hypothetical protein ACFWNH_28970 [Rhodococcus qingshengii]